MKTIRKLIFIIFLLGVCGALFELNYERLGLYDEPMMTQGCTCYDQLTSNQQYVYRRLYRYSSKMKTVILMLAFEKEDVGIAVQAVLYDHPEFYWFASSECEYNDKMVIFDLSDEEKQEMAATYEQCQKKADEMIATFVYENDFEAIRCIHDALLQRLNYSLFANNDQDIRSAFIDCGTVCAGYARAFELLCHKMGFKCGYYTGTSTFSKSGSRHAWNYVELDGEMFWVDCTWDDINVDNDYERKYGYFMICDELLFINHMKDEYEMFETPNCTSYRFAQQTGNQPPVSEVNIDFLNSEMLEHLENEGMYEVRFSSIEKAQDYYDYLFDGGNDNNFVRLVRDNLFPFDGFKYTYSIADDGYVTVSLMELD